MRGCSFGWTRRHERSDRIERLEPLSLQVPKVDRRREIEPREILVPNPSAALQQLQDGQRREARVLATRCPAQGAEHQYRAVEVKHIENVARLVAAGERESLVDREIDGMEHEPGPLIAHGGKEPPGRVACPFDLGRVSALAEDGADEAGLIQVELDRVLGARKQVTIRRERLGDARLRIVRVVEVAAESRRVGLDQDGGPAREIRIEGAVGG